MSLVKPLPFADRLRVLGLFLASYFAGLVPWALLGGEGFWWACILFVFSLPVLGVALVTVPLFAGSIVERPYVWAMGGAGGVVTFYLLAMALLGLGWLGLVSLLLVVPTTLVFMAIARWRPLWWPTDRV